MNSLRLILYCTATISLFLPAPARAAAAETPGYQELRIYTVSSNKMEAVLERFRETVEPLRKKHGIETIGYWTAPGLTNGGTFIYLMNAATRDVLTQREKEFGEDSQFKASYTASIKKHGKTVDEIVALRLAIDPTAKLDFIRVTPPRAFNLRIYSVLPGKLDAFRDRWRDHAVPIYERHGLHSLGWWVAENKDANGNDQFICLLAGESVASIENSITAFHQDADWQRVEQDTEKDGKLRSGVTAYKLTPADFSLIQ